MFSRHRDDLLRAFEAEREATQQTIRILADQVDYLRYMVMNQPTMTAAQAVSQPAVNVDPNFRPYLTEDEEELLALRLNDHISESDLRAIQEELADVIQLPTPQLEADE
jgi:hypothetical protein